MRIPGFTAQQALDRSLTQYRTTSSDGYSTSSVRNTYPQASGIPERHGCWCSEPDTRTVCDHRGNCFEKWVCLQWFCRHHESETEASHLGH